MLDLLERALGQEELRYQRIDGSKTLSQRRDALQMFREDISCNVLLASLGSAAVGYDSTNLIEGADHLTGNSLDLTAACQVHLIEPSWNPMLERQALDRVHRLGQENPVHTFRYMVDKNDSIEKVSCP
jgi:SNF2 family DNA or RNA helicase